MDLKTATIVLVFLAVGLAWMYLNLKASVTWLKLISLLMMLGCLTTATVLAVLAIR